MVKFFVISIVCIVIGSFISDKVEKRTSQKENTGANKNKDVVDIETLRILNNYGLIDVNNYKNSFSNFDKA